MRIIVGGTNSSLSAWDGNKPCLVEDDDPKGNRGDQESIGNRNGQFV